MNWSEFLSYIRHISKRDQKRVKEAFELSEDLHKDQKRKSGEPYFIHPATIAMRLAFIGADADTLIAALLHDTVEDTPITLEEIKAQFNGDVTKLIDGVTKLSAADVAEKPNLNEQVETIRKIFRLMEQDIRIMVIKLFDRLHNMETIRFLSEKRQINQAQETMDVFVKIADRLCMQDVRYELERLCLHVLEPELYERLETLREQNMKHGKKVIQEMQKKLKSLRPDLNEGVAMQFEFKSWDQLRAQLEADGSNITGLTSITVVFVCDSRELCYQVLGALHDPWKRESMSFQDYINSPMINGYQGLHTTIILEDGTRVRCKIRTQEMQEYARKGVAMYAFDSKKRRSLSELLPWTKRLSSLAEGTRDRSDEFWMSLQNDILSESIVVYGPGDKTVQLPKGSTVLDGAFHLFTDHALTLKSIKMNGKEVPFYTPLVPAATLEAQFDKTNTVKMEWIDWTHTTFSLSKIRASFSEHSEKEKIHIGKEILQRLLEEKKKGFLEEFDAKMLDEAAEKVGYPHIKQAYMAIGEGRLQSNQMYDALFSPKTSNGTKKYSCTFRFSIDSDDDAMANGMILIQKKYADAWRDVRRKKDPLPLRTEQVSLTMKITDMQKESILSELAAAGISTIRVTTSTALYAGITAGFLLCVLWGLDPVLAKLLLNTAITPELFAEVRAITVLCFAFLLFVFSGLGKKFSRIPLSYPSLWIAGVSFFLLNIFTYLALNYGSPVLYNTTLRGNAFLLAIPTLYYYRHYTRLIVALLLAIGGYAILTYSPFASSGFLLSIGVLVSFAIYTLASARFQYEAKVAARYSQFFFFTSFIAALSSLPLFITLGIPLESVSPTLLGVLILYCIGFIGVPYIIFYAATRQAGYSFISPWINISLLVTFIGQYFTMGLGKELIVVPAAALLIGASYLSSRAIYQHPSRIR